MLTHIIYWRMTLEISRDFTNINVPFSLPLFFSFSLSWFVPLFFSLSVHLIIYRITDHVLPQRECRGSITWYSRDRIRFVRNKRNCATHETVISISYVTGFVSFPPFWTMPTTLLSSRRLSPRCLFPSSLSPSFRSASTFARPSRPIRPSCLRFLTPPRDSSFFSYIVYCSLLAY